VRRRGGGQIARVQKSNSDTGASFRRPPAEGGGVAGFGRLLKAEDGPLRLLELLLQLRCVRHHGLRLGPGPLNELLVKVDNEPLVGRLLLCDVGPEPRVLLDEGVDLGDQLQAPEAAGVELPRVGEVPLPLHVLFQPLDLRRLPLEGNENEVVVEEGVRGEGEAVGWGVRRVQPPLELGVLLLAEGEVEVGVGGEAEGRLGAGQVRPQLQNHLLWIGEGVVDVHTAFLLLRRVGVPPGDGLFTGVLRRGGGVGRRRGVLAEAEEGEGGEGRGGWDGGEREVVHGPRSASHPRKKIQFLRYFPSKRRFHFGISSKMSIRCSLFVDWP
jgi:hypothetical protein